jgi:hypothetical protein
MDEFRRKPTPWTTPHVRPTLMSTPPAQPVNTPHFIDLTSSPNAGPQEAPLGQQTAQTVPDIKIILPSSPLALGQEPTPQPTKQAATPNQTSQDDSSSHTIPESTPALTPMPKKVSNWQLRSQLSKILILGSGIVGGAAVAVLLIVLLFHFPSSTAATKSAANISGLAAGVTSQVKGFHVYYPDGTLPGKFKLNQASVNYRAGVLVFQLKDTNGKTLTFSEQAIPSNYDISGERADKVFETAVGHAYITNATFRTTGELFTLDKTWILVNAPSPVGVDVMTNVLNSLQHS